MICCTAQPRPIWMSLKLMEISNNIGNEKFFFKFNYVVIFAIVLQFKMLSED
jgi:hypothetical protein